MLLLSWLIHSAAFASAPLPSQIDWPTALRYTIQNNSEVLAAKETLSAAGSSAAASRNGYFPHLDATGDALYGTPDKSKSSAEKSYSAGLKLTENIFAGFQDLARVDQALDTEKEDEALLTAAKAKISADLKNTFEGVVYAQDFSTLTQDIIRRRSDNLRLVELRFESGRENKGSLLLSKAYLAQADYEHLQALHANDVARAQLAKTLGIDTLESKQVTGSPPFASPPDAEPDFAKLAVLTPEHIQAVAKENTADSAITESRAGYYPNLNLVGSARRHVAMASSTTTDSWSGGLELSWPLLSGGKDFYTSRAAVATYNAATATLVNSDRNSIVLLRQAFSKFSEAVAKLNVDESFLLAARSRAEIARSKYNNGLLSFEDWDIIENDLIVREKAVLSSRRDRVAAEAGWEQAQGKGAIP